jgi:hypothetical protein
MTDPRSKSEPISETAKSELVKVYIKEVYGRDKEINSKYIEKGLAVEEDSITLLSRVKKKFLVKNDQRETNDFITGEPDIVKPALIDTKSCWDLHSFYNHKVKPLTKDYYWQMMGYCELFECTSGTIAFCLIDTPLGIIEQEKKSLYWRMNVATMENPDYLAACEQLEREMTFADIPMEERVHEVLVKWSPEEMQKCHERILLCREWLNEFADKTVTV